MCIYIYEHKLNRIRHSQAATIDWDNISYAKSVYIHMYLTRTYIDASTESLPEETHGHINSAFYDGMATTITTALNLIGRHLYTSMQAAQPLTSKLCQVLCNILYISYLVRWLRFQCDISWLIIHDSVTLFMDLETRGVILSNRPGLLCIPRRFV